MQHALRNILIDLPSVVNIADDLLVFGESVEKHDEHLTKVLDRLEEKGIPHWIKFLRELIFTIFAIFLKSAKISSRENF